MTVDEYRKKRSHCKFCKHAVVQGDDVYCSAREQRIFFNKAKKCPLFKVEEYKGRDDNIIIL